jgi:hypothetical protein
VENQQELPQEDPGRGGRFDPWSNEIMTLGETFIFILCSSYYLLGLNGKDSTTGN